MSGDDASPLSPGSWVIDPVHSSINFSVRHLMVSAVRGRFDRFSGAIAVAEDGTASVQARIDVESLSTGKDQRDAHVRSANFFDVEHYPVADFRSTAVAPTGDSHVLSGDLTLKGVTKPVDLSLVFNGTNPGMGRGEVAGFTAAIVLNRKDFGIDVDLPLQTGGVVVGDDVTVNLDIEALKQP